MAELNWTDEASTNLEEIFRYIAEDNPDAARGVVEGIYARTRILRDFPLIGHRYEERPDREIRILLYGHYRIAYLVRSEDSIDILGVFHGAMDMARWLSDR